MTFLVWLQSSSLAVWVGSADTIWAYPTILALHTVGLAVVVGANLIVDFRLLGAAPSVPVSALSVVYRPMWLGFTLNALTGALLFIAGAEWTGVNPMFYLKLLLIAGAITLAVKIRRTIFGGDPAGVIRPRARTLAVLSLILWTAAIFAGRYTAYYK